jgi:ubiquinone biosynthesis protein Coq4
MVNQSENEGRRAILMRQFVAISQPFYRKFSRRKSTKWRVTMTQLSQYSPDSFGGVLYHFLHIHQFYLMTHFESHDVFHVLLGYTPSVLDEARMQYCLLGSGRYSLYVMMTCFAAVFVYPERCLDFLRHYQRGKTLQHFSYWDFEALLPVAMDCVQKRIKRDSIETMNAFD